VDSWSDAATIGISAHRGHDLASPTTRLRQKTYCGDLRNDTQMNVEIDVQFLKNQYRFMFESSLQMKRKIARKLEVNS